MSADAAIVPITFHMHESGSRISLNLPTTALVSDVKTTLHEVSGMPACQCEILFCGQKMNDNDNLESYKIDSQTTLHVVSNFSYRKLEPLTRCKIPLLTGIWTHRLGVTPAIMSRTAVRSNIPRKKNDKRLSFFAYCKSYCAKIVRSKSRVRCATCKKDTISLLRDPQKWLDVIKSEQIMGNCYSKDCSGVSSYAEFYFKCTSCSDESGNVVPLPNVISNPNGIICLTCLEYEDPVVVFPCRQDHIMCLYCFEQYARCSLREKSMVLHSEVGYTLECPEGCRSSCLTDTHVLHILGSDEYQMYHSYAAEKCLLQIFGGLICPNPKCGAGLYTEGESVANQKVLVVCTSCGHEFCSACQEAFHGSTSCCDNKTRQLGSRNSKAVDDYFASILTIEQIAKKCPKCQAPTQRNGGCMHMTCKMCCYEWCWSCCSEWSGDCQADHWFG